MSTIVLIAVLTAPILAFILAIVAAKLRELARAEFVRTYMFPPGLLEKLAARRPDLVTKDLQLVARALRQFFVVYLKSGRKYVSMPSQVVDELWHEFILYTRHYDMFCRKAFGQFMHHTPAVVLGANQQNNSGIRRVWWYGCLEDNINPRKATRLPLLFAIDSKLKIANGFHYVLDCKGITRDKGTSTSTVHCGGDMSSLDFDGTTDGFGDSTSGDAGGGGGDSGGGCGGGCGGG